MKLGDLVRWSPSVYGVENTLGLVIETNVNMWGEEAIPSGVRVLWHKDITVESEDDVEVVQCKSATL
jgi:hypothetical protein